MAGGLLSVDERFAHQKAWKNWAPFFRFFDATPEDIHRKTHSPSVLIA